MTHSLYLIIERAHAASCGKKRVLQRVTKRKPVLPRPTEQALVRLEIQIPDGLFEPRCVPVQIKPEHIVPPVVTANSSAP